MTSGRSSAPPPEAPIGAAFLLLFPLAVAGGAIGVAEEVHTWTIEILEKIGNTMGIQQALSLIPRMKMRRQCWETGDVDMVIYALSRST
jgi:hypothetical protein